MTRLMACLLVLTFGLVAILESKASADTATPLPIQIEIDIGSVHDIDSHPDRAALEALITALLEKRIRKKLSRHWFVSNGAGISRLVLTVDQAGANFNLLIDLEFHGDIRSSVSFLGRAPSTLPRQQPTFDRELVNALFEFFGQKDPDIVAASTQVHGDTDDGLKTVLHLDRPLDRDSAAFFFAHKLNLTWDHVGTPMTVEAMPGESLLTPMLLNPDETRKGTISPDVRQSRPGELPVAKFCIHRPRNDDPPVGTEPLVALLCPLQGTCTLQATTPENWAHDDCTVPIRYVPEMPRWSWGAAHAATPEPESWSVPDLDVLFERVRDFPGRFVGFTEFTLNASRLANLDADAFTVRVLANGVPILINGLRSKDREHPFDPDFGLFYRFGLENLKFAGREDGCEDISVAFQFLKDGEPVGEEVVLTRRYASLRHAPQRRFETAFGVFTWDGAYVAPGNRNENGIFLASARFLPGDEQDERDALQRLNAMRMRLDDFGWTISAGELGVGLGLESVLEGEQDDVRLAIVGKLRPPRTIFSNGEAAYGLLVGVEEPSGQLQFTFDRQQIRALQRLLNTNRTGSSDARSVVPAERDRLVFAYNEPRRIAPEWVCRNR